eukprot:s1003_g14.t1
MESCTAIFSPTEILEVSTPWSSRSNRCFFDGTAMPRIPQQRQRRTSCHQSTEGINASGRAEFCVALGDICLRKHTVRTVKVTSAFVLCGRRGTYGTGLALVAALVTAGSVWRRASFAWQAWQLATSAFVLCGGGLGRRWVRVAPRLFCMAGVALVDICLRFVWQAWHLRHWAGSGGGFGRRWVRVALCLFCMAGWHLATSAFVLYGRRGTWGHLPSFCVAGVALCTIADTDLRLLAAHGAIQAAALLVKRQERRKALLVKRQERRKALQIR